MGGKMMWTPTETWMTAAVKLFMVLSQPSGHDVQLSTVGIQPKTCQLPERRIHATPTTRQQQPFTIIVEGTVGCGKSTLLDIVSPLPGVMAIPEPVGQWQNVNGTDLLQLMFQDGERWAGVFQMESTLTRLKAALQKPVAGDGGPALVRIMERSLYSERYCFLEYLHKFGPLSDPEYNVMDRWFRFAVQNFEQRIKPDLIIFLKTDMDTVLKRIAHRGREEEEHIDVDFVNGINQMHEDWLIHGNSSFPVPAPVLVMNGSLSLQDFKEYVHQNIDQIIPQHLQPYILNQ